MTPEQEAFFQESTAHYKIVYSRLRADRLATRQQMMAGDSVSYSNVEYLTPNPDEVYERCKEKLAFYKIIIRVDRWVPVDKVDFWTKETHQHKEFTLILFGSTFSETIDMAEEALRQSAIMHPAKTVFG